MQTVSIAEAASLLSVSERHIWRLVKEAEENPRKSTWRMGREILNLGLPNQKRILRINLDALTS